MVLARASALVVILGSAIMAIGSLGTWATETADSFVATIAGAVLAMAPVLHPSPRPPTAPRAGA